MCWNGWGKPFATILAHFGLGFVGGVSGWICLHLAYTRGKSQFGKIELILLVLGILGISGKLGTILWELPNAAKEKFYSTIRN